MSPPIISPYKRWFAFKRIVQTFLGGPKLVANCGVMFFEVVIYLIPVIVVLCVVGIVDSHTVPWEWKALFAGVGMFLTDVALTFLIWILKQRKDTIVVPEVGSETNRTTSLDRTSTSATLFDEEEAVPSDGCLKSSFWRFIAANVNMSLWHFSAVLVSAISILLTVSILADDLVHPVLKGFVIFTLCNARYSAVINSPAEVATFDPVRRRHLCYRTFYVALLAFMNFAVLLVRDSVNEASSNNSVHTGERALELEEYLLRDDEISNSSTTPPPQSETLDSTSSSFFGIFISLLPLVWVMGVLPPLDSLFPWLLELALNGFGGKSIGYTYFGTTMSLTFAIAGPLTTFVLSQDIKITFLLECLCGYLISSDTGSMPKLKASLCEDVPVKYFLQQMIKPAVTIILSLLCVFIVETTVIHMESVPSREIFHPVLAALSIFVLLTTKVVQIFDLLRYPERKYSRLCLSIFTMWHGLLTLLLHVWLTLELTTEHLEASLTKSLDAVVHSLHELMPCVLAIRAYALAVTEPNKSTITFIVAFLFHKLNLSEPDPFKFVTILFLCSLSLSILKRLAQYLRMLTIVLYATFASNLLDRKYVAGVALLSTPLTATALLISSILKGVNLVPVFTLPIFTLGFPRPQSFWKGIWFLTCGRNETQKILPVASSVDWTIYADLAPFLVHAFAKHGDEMKSEFEAGSCFIARYDDRLLFIRVISSGWKFLYCQVKGLEIQEQTSCHHQEAAWMDELFDRYLHSGMQTWKRKLFTVPLSLINSLEPKFCLSVPSYSESKSQLPNFLTRTEKQIFRDMFFRAFSYLWIKSNPAFQGESYRRPIASGVPLGKGKFTKMQSSSRLLDREPSFERTASNTSNGYWASNSNKRASLNDERQHNRQQDVENQFQLSTLGGGSDLNGNRAAARSKLKESTESISSGGSFRGTSAPMRQHPPHLKDVSAANWQGSVSYPLIPGLPNLAVEESELEYIPSSITSQNEGLSELEQELEKNEVPTPPKVGSRRKESLWDGLPQLWMKQCVGDAIPHNAVKARVDRLCWRAWEIAFGTNDDFYEVDLARFYRREFAKNIRTALIHERPGFEEIAMKAFRYATKLTLDEIYASGMDLEDPLISSSSVSSSSKQQSCSADRSEEDEENIFDQLSSFEKTHCFCPYDEVPYWINEKAKHIVSISADGDKNILRMFNYRSEGVQFGVGELNRMCVEGIWSSLNTELLYLTSDDDERYSIQHSKYLLRNICAQSAQTLGYPVYEATFRMNLFDFSLEQLSS